MINFKLLMQSRDQFDVFYQAWVPCVEILITRFFNVFKCQLISNTKMTNNTFASSTQKLSLKCNSEAYILWDGLYNDDWNNHMRPICSATQMIKAFFLRQLIPNSKHINHVFSCFASRTQNLSSLYKFEASYLAIGFIYTLHIYTLSL